MRVLLIFERCVLCMFENFLYRLGSDLSVPRRSHSTSKIRPYATEAMLPDVTPKPSPSERLSVKPELDKQQLWVMWVRPRSEVPCSHRGNDTHCPANGNYVQSTLGMRHTAIFLSSY